MVALLCISALMKHWLPLMWSTPRSEGWRARVGDGTGYGREKHSSSKMADTRSLLRQRCRPLRVLILEDSSTGIDTGRALHRVEERCRSLTGGSGYCGYSGVTEGSGAESEELKGRSASRQEFGDLALDGDDPPSSGQ